MATAFVTGANGFIGRHLLALLLSRGDSVVGLVRTTSDTSALAASFDEHGDRLRLILGDLRDPPSLTGALDNADYIFHLGAVLLGARESDFREAIVDGTANLLASVEAHGT